MKKPHPLVVTIPSILCLLLIGGCSQPALFEQEYGVVYAELDSSAAIPRGMRRTTRGWEDTSLWYVSPDLETRSIDALIDRQRKIEPSWARAICDKLRATPPLMFAVVQITAIAAIVRISRVQRQNGADVSDL